MAYAVTFAITAAAAGCGSSDNRDAPATAAATAIAGATTASADAAEPLKIAYFGPRANTYAKATFDGLEEVAGEAADVTWFDSGFDPAKQFAQIDDAVTQQKFDGFVVLPLDGVGIKPNVEAAIEAGIKVVNVNNALGPDQTKAVPQIEGQVAAVFDPPALRGKAMGDAAVEACGDKDPCRVAFINGVDALPLEQEIKRQIKQTLAAAPNVELVAYQSAGGFLPDPAQKVAANLLKAHPDLDVIGATGDQLAAGVELAVVDAGKEPGIGEGQIRILGGGASEVGVEAVRSGRWFATQSSLPIDEGRLAMEALLEAIGKDEVESRGISPAEVKGIPTYFTKENLEDFQAQWPG